MKTLTITFPNDKTTIVQPVPRSGLAAFTKHLTEVQAIWISEGFSTADAIARGDCWGHMQAIAKMLPHHDAAAVLGFDLESLGNDYQQLERLFFGDASKAYDPAYLNLEQALSDGFNLELFRGCALYELHHFEPKKKLIQANKLRLVKLQAELSSQKTSPSKAVATEIQTPSLPLSKDLERKTA